MGNKINKLLSEGIPNGVFFSKWLTANNYSPQLLSQYKKSGWLESLDRSVYYSAGEQLSAYAAVASNAIQTNDNLRLAAHSALELHGIMHFIPMGKPLAVVTTDIRHKMQWLHAPLFDRQFVYFHTQQLSDMPPERIIYNDLQIPVSSQELAVMECLYLAPKQYSYMDVYYLVEQLGGLRPEIIQELLEKSTNFRVKRMFLYMAEKTGFEWFMNLDLRRIDLGSSILQLTTANGTFIKKYNMVIPLELKNYE